MVTEPLAANFDKALDLIKSALETGASRAAYLNGSFGSGKSHFMVVLYAILKGGDPDVRGKKGLADVVAKHDKWLNGRKFLLVPYHLPDSQFLMRPSSAAMWPTSPRSTRASRSPPSTAMTA